MYNKFITLRNKVQTFFYDRQQYTLLSVVIYLLGSIIFILHFPKYFAVSNNSNSPVAKWRWENSMLIDTATNRGYKVKNLNAISIEFIPPKVMNFHAQQLQRILDKLDSKDIYLEKTERSTIVHMI